MKAARLLAQASLTNPSSMIKAFDGIHGKIAVALVGPGLALAAAVSSTGGATAQHEWGGHPAHVVGATPLGPAASRIIRVARVAISGPAQPGALLPAAVVTTALSGVASGESAFARHRRARIGRSPRQIARWLLIHRFHWRRWQFHYLNLLWDRESGWNSRAWNPYSGAYGIPQAVPGIKMASAGPNWRSDARTQIRWGMRYIRDRYRTPYWAWRHEVSDGWY